MPFLAALACTVLLALAVGVAITRMSVAGSAQPPDQPPYCDSERLIAGRRLLPQAAAGCPVSAQAARSTAAELLVGGGSVREAVLARVSQAGPGAVGRDRLAWVVVLHSDFLLVPATRCAPPRASGPACAVSGLGAVSNEEVVVVDGDSGQILATVPIPDG